MFHVPTYTFTLYLLNPYKIFLGSEQLGQHITPKSIMYNNLMSFKKLEFDRFLEKSKLSHNCRQCQMNFIMRQNEN